MLDSESESENENESENQQVNNDPLIKLIESRDIEKIRKTVTPSGLEKSAEKFKENLLEYSLKVSHKLKQSADGSHRKDLDNLGSSVEEYARRLLKYSVYKQWSQESDFIDCIDRITYAAIHFRCKKFLSGSTTQNYLKKLWMSNEESEGSVKWILVNLFALFEFAFFPLIFVAYVYRIVMRITGQKSEDRRPHILGRYSNHFNIPYFVFLRDTLSYVALLMLHIAVCVQPSDLRLSVLEWFIMVFFIGRFMQEIDQFLLEKDEKHGLKTNYSNDFWNKLDALTIVLYVITFIFRLVTWSVTSRIIENDWLVGSSCLYGINAALLSLRVFGQTMEVKQATGTKQIALLRIISAVFVIFVQMVAAILAFSLILTKIYVSDISYVGRKTSHGVCSSSDGILCWWLFIEFLAWSAVGSSDPDLLTLTTAASNYISKSIYMLFLIVVAVMIMNMLIALLSNIYQLVEENAYAEWCYRKACLIKTYRNYHPVPVPFNIITLSIKLFCVLLLKLERRVQCVEEFKLREKHRVEDQDNVKKLLRKRCKLLSAEYLAEFGNSFPLQESPEEKILIRNQRLLRHIVREVYSGETQLNKTSEWHVVDDKRPVSFGNQRLYIQKCNECNKDAHDNADGNPYCTHSVRNEVKLSRERPGFEILIEYGGKRHYLGIGLTSKQYGNYFPGRKRNSVGYHAHTGAILAEKDLSDEESPDETIQGINPFPDTGSMIGCTVLFDEPATDDGYLTVEFTRNRRLLGKALAKPENLHPFVAMGHPGIKLLFRFVKDASPKEKDELSNQKAIHRLNEEMGALKEICQHLQRQNEEMKELLLQNYRSMDGKR